MVSIQLDDNVAKSLEFIARAQGMSLSDFLSSLARTEGGPSAMRPSADEIVAMFEEEAGSVSSEYRGTYSREDIYSDHD